MTQNETLDAKTPSPHPFPFSRAEKGRLEPPLSTGGEGSGVRMGAKKDKNGTAERAERSKTRIKRQNAD